MALKKGTMIYSVVKMKCPYCHEGDFFISHPYDLKNMGKEHKQCSECGNALLKEPGFYLGSMYVTYAFNVAIFVACFVLYWLIFRRIDVWTLLIIIIVASLVTTPIIYAISKLIWANFFIHYDKDAIAKHKAALAEQKTQENSEAKED